MVFLFPGVLFRKFYFTGNFGNQFGQGNLLERFLWSIFLSFVCLTSVSLILYFLSTFCGIKPLDEINFNGVSHVFQSLSENKFPDEFKEKDRFISFLLLLLLIYIISASLGYLINKFLLLFSLENFSAFKFNNNWHYLSKAYKANNVRKNFGDNHITFVDVLTTSNSSEVLYRGILNNFILDKDDKLENVILSKAYRFINLDKKEDLNKIETIEESIRKDENVYLIHRESKSKVIYLKSIDGNLLVLSKENILNINFTYVKISNKIQRWREFVYKASYILFLLIFIILVILPFLQLNNEYLRAIDKKITFSVTTFFLAAFIINFITDFIKPQNLSNDTNVSIRDTIFIFVLFSSPYLWVFEFLNLKETIATSLIIFIIFAIVTFINNKKNN